jgi:hypothetical protein
MARRGLSPEQRFWQYVIQDDDEHCWTWIGAMSGRYGKFFVRREGGKVITEYAHRFSDILAHGPIPPGVEVDHLCNNTTCVNPNHFERVSQAENKRRQGERKTHCKYGHEFTWENTYIDGRGQRRCRTCAAERRKAA